MIVIKNRLIPFGDYTSINLFGIVFTKVEMSEKSINHERIHTAQFLELASVTAIVVFILRLLFGISGWWFLTSFITYYAWYIFEYMWISVMHSKQLCAYGDVSFEEEAYANDTNMEYIKQRNAFAWWKYRACESNHKDKDKDCCN